MAGKFGTSFMASVTVAVLWKLAFFKSLLVWTCQLVLILFGREEPPEPIKQKLEIVAGKAMQVAEPDGDAPLPLATIREKLTDPVAEASEEVKEKPVLSVQESMKATVQEKIAAPVVEVAEQAKEKAEQATTVVKEEVAEVRDTVKEGAEKVADKLEGLGGNSGPGYAGFGAGPPPPYQQRPGFFGGLRASMDARAMEEAAKQAEEAKKPKYGLSATQKAIKARQRARNQAALGGGFR